MDDKLKKRVERAYANLREETTDEEGIIKGGVDSLTLGCFLDNKCKITKCMSDDYQAEDSFLIKKDDDNIAKYSSEDYTITSSTIPGWIEITKKGTGKCCPFYKDNCRFILESIFREIYGEENKIV
ncbi:MAG: hypothetical protein Q7K54_05245 [Candidatus Parcubacteria bacterium]|nr:hypothetical protein [Candidatus Parcubacteria bacterium]